MSKTTTGSTSSAPRLPADVVLPPPGSQQERFETVADAQDAKQLAATFRLQVDQHSRAKSTLSNIIEAIANSDLWRGHVWYDEFLDRILIRDGAVREWSDYDDVRGAAFLQRYLLMDKVSPTMMHAAVSAYCTRDARRHCVRDWLDTLEWDGTERIAAAFEDHWGVACDEHMPADYVRAASANFLISMAARIYRPGCQVDHMPVFEGKQGRGKTSALRVLGGEYYAQQSDSVSSKDFFQTLPGKWLLEIGELDAFSRAEVTRVKTVISTSVDRYRPSYGRSASDHPRQCVFAGTTNKDDWGNDETGLRRFWPIRCGEINLKTLADARTQLFAEAVHRFKAGATWWAMPTGATLDVQQTRQQEEALSGLISMHLASHDQTTVSYVLLTVLKIEPGSIRKQHEMMAAKVLKGLGWERSPKRSEGGSRVWLNPNVVL